MIKKLIAFPVVIILTLLLAKPYLSANFPYTHDGENHLARFANYKIAVREGQFPPRFAPNLINHYGYPVFNYNYPLANLLSLPFSILGVNYEVTFKLLVILFAGVGLWGLTKWLASFETCLTGLIFGLLVFASSPFIWSTLLYRGNIGEIAAYFLFPWLLWLVEQARDNQRSLVSYLVIISYLLAHNTSVMIGLPLMLIYAIFRYGRNWQSYWQLVKLVLIGIASTLWFWLPAVIEKDLVSVGRVSLVKGFTQHFPTLNQLFFSHQSFGFSNPGSVDGLAFHLGYAQILVLIISGIYLLKTNKLKTLFSLVWLLSGLLIIFQLQFTQSLWQLIPLASFIQFPWRLSLFLSPLLAWLASHLWRDLPKWLKRFLWIIVAVQLVSMLLLKSADYFHKTNVDYDVFSQSTTTLNENTPLTFTYQQIASWQPSPTVATGSASIQVINWSGSSRHYQLEVTQKSIITEPTMYFAGWQTKVKQDQTWQSIDQLTNAPLVEGRIGYELNPGNYEVKSVFTQNTWPRILGNLISFLTLAYLVYRLLKEIFNPKIAIYLLWLGGLFFLAWTADNYLLLDPSFPYSESLLQTTGLPAWIYSWANFDGVHYLTIINKGYLGTGLIQAFFPIFPGLIKSLGFISSSPLILGLMINAIFTWLILGVIEKLIKLDHRLKHPELVYTITLLFPTSLFFHAFYSEAIFLYLVLTSFYQARRGNWLKAGLMAAIASATRVTGILLLPALLFEFRQQYQSSWREHLKELSYIFLGALGLLAYMLFLQLEFGDFLYFFHVQAEFGGIRQEQLIPYPQVVWRYLKILWLNKDLSWSYFISAQEFLAGTLGLLAIIWSWFRVRKPYVIFSLLAFVVPTLTGTFSSLPRYLLSSFSILILLMLMTDKNKWQRISWIALSSLLLILNIILFIQGYWVA